jgi:hypothetical protein
MSRTYHHGKNNPNRYKKAEVDYRKFGKAIIDLSQAELETEALSEHRRRLKLKELRVKRK